MLSLPMLTRELRAIARAPGTHRLRLLVGIVGVGVLAVALVEKGSGLNRGAQLFEQIHIAAFFTLLFLTPLLTADTISKEKREGTLDLLYLTSLSAARVVAAKFATQFIRIVSIWALLIPLTMVPLLSGGVSPSDVVFALSIEFSVILLALVAGLFASAIAKRTLATMFLAIFFSVVLWWFDLQILRAAGLFGQAGKPAANEVLAVRNLISITFLTPMLLVGIARMVSREQSKAGPSPRALRFRKIFLTPRFWRNRFQTSMTRRMDRNPLIWLEYRTAWSRVGRSTLVGALILLESLVILFDAREIAQYHQIVALSLLGLLAITASISFQREKENGAFELLLVAPFTERSLISGRLFAVWTYYAPVWLTFALLVAVTQAQGFDWYPYDPYMLSYVNPNGYREGVGALISLLLSTITIPVAGLYFALRMKYFLAALLATAFVGFVAPMYFWTFGHEVLSLVCAWFANPMWALLLIEPYRNGSFPYISAAVAVHALIAAPLAFAIHGRLKARKFA